jgi:outer membrane protein OmpA-like peptidoglycan-associated protein
MTALILAALIAQAPVAPAPADTAPRPAAAPGDQHGLGEEVITGSSEVKIIDTKTWFAPQIDPFAPIDDVLAPETYVLDEALYRSVDSMTIPQHFARSSFLRVPIERDFIYGDMMLFLPSFESRVASWELVVANSLGETVRRVTRKGQPPAVITWDGRDEKGAAISPGEMYSFTFNAYDARGNQTRIPGPPQRVNAMVFKDDNEWVVSAAADRLFAEGSAQLADGAGARLDEAANVIKERFRKEVVIYVYSEQEKLSADRCRVMQDEIARRVVLPREALKVAPRFVPGLQPKLSKVEIHIL